MNDIVPAVCAKWPAGEFNNPRFKIRMQQDGAPGHIKPTDPEWLEYLEDAQLKDKLILFDQPANSPDTNMNDMGFFNALQAVYWRECPRG